jgi:hypothetical protein
MIVDFSKEINFERNKGNSNLQLSYISVDDFENVGLGNKPTSRKTKYAK